LLGHDAISEHPISTVAALHYDSLAFNQGITAILPAQAGTYGEFTQGQQQAFNISGLILVVVNYPDGGLASIVDSASAGTAGVLQLEQNHGLSIDALAALIASYADGTLAGDNESGLISATGLLTTGVNVSSVLMGQAGTAGLLQAGVVVDEIFTANITTSGSVAFTVNAVFFNADLHQFYVRIIEFDDESRLVEYLNQPHTVAVEESRATLGRKAASRMTAASESRTVELKTKGRGVTMDESRLTEFEDNRDN